MSETHSEAQRGIETSYPVVELRQYTLKPRRREELIELFDTHFVEGQERYGMRVIGQFRRPAVPDQFVWLRGFRDMETRQQALQGFYTGPIWQEHRAATNDTMIDSDNVLLLKPVHATTGLHLDPALRPVLDAPETAGGVVIVAVYSFDTPVDASFVKFFEAELAPALRAAGAALLGYYVTEPAENTFPQLPVREGEHVFVWLASFADAEAYATYQKALAAGREWATALVPTLRNWLLKPAELLELTPTRRSLLRHSTI